jgi:hypothetical protein
MLRAKEIITLPDRQIMIPISVAHEDSLGGEGSAILVVRWACVLVTLMSRQRWRKHKFRECRGQIPQLVMDNREFFETLEMNQLNNIDMTRPGSRYTYTTTKPNKRKKKSKNQKSFSETGTAK